jgi:copper homeostasis protein
MLIECIATTLEDAKRIEQAGADRIELVSSLTEGGLTPSFGLIESVISNISIPVNVMVRPHAQSFCYSDDDIKIMKKDIETMRFIGATGVVFGALDEHNHIDYRALESLLEVSKGLEITFHRAVDCLVDPVQGVAKLTKYKEISSILTSGGVGDWPDRLQMIKEMANVSGHISILVGSGLTKRNIIEVHRQVQTNQYHFGTALRLQQSPIQEIDLQETSEIINMLKKRGDTQNEDYTCL